MKTNLLSLALALPALLAVGCTDPKPVDVSAEPPPPISKPKDAPAKAKTAAPEVFASGTIELPAGSKATGKLVFVSLKAVGGKGPPIAAQRLPAGPFPMAFEISSANVMAMGGQARPVPAEFVLKATLDVDGNPMQKSAGDLVVTQKLKKGAKAVKLSLAPPQ